MSTSATINLSGSSGYTNPEQKLYNEGQYDSAFLERGETQPQVHQGGSHGQVFHVSGNQVSHIEEPVRQIIAPGPKLAFSASHYPQNPQQQQYQQQFQMQPQYQPQQQFQIQQQFQPVSQNFQPHYQQQTQSMHDDAHYQPHEQYQQQYAQPQQMQHQPIQMTNVHPQMAIQTKDHRKAPIFEVPVSKIQIVKKNQAAPLKTSSQNMQQSFRSSRSGSFATLDEITDPPHFVKHPQPHQTSFEGNPVRLCARVIPAGDPNLTVQWYKDGQPLVAGSRFNTSFDRGFAILEILYTFKEDSGEYSCVSKNNFGMDQTTPSILRVTADENVVMNSHLPREMAANIAAMEASLNAQKISKVQHEETNHPPKFVRPMPSIFNLREGQHVHLETVFIPTNDSALSVEWYKNKKPLNNGSRFNMISDRGFAILDIVGLIPEDAGEYFCVARNSMGQAQSNIAKLSVSVGTSVDTTSQLPKECTRQLEALDSYLHDDQARPDFRYEETVEEDSPPQFDIKPMDVVIEDGGPAKFLVKVSGFPPPSIQWFLNSSPVVSTPTQRVYNDGLISYFEFNKYKHVGQHNIQVIIKNHKGEATANATLTVMASKFHRPELKYIDPENSFKKLSNLKKVEVSSELENALRRQKPKGVGRNQGEGEGMREKQNHSYESSVAENLYTNVQAKLKKSDRPSYAGASVVSVTQSENPTIEHKIMKKESVTPHSQKPKREHRTRKKVNVAPGPVDQPALQNTEIRFNLNRPQNETDQNLAEFNLQIEY